jgi:hypothetical protein
MAGGFCTFLAAFRCLRCFAALAFSILCLSRTGVRFDFETGRRLVCDEKSCLSHLQGFTIVSVVYDKAVVSSANCVWYDGRAQPRFREPISFRNKTFQAAILRIGKSTRTHVFQSDVRME